MLQLLENNLPFETISRQCCSSSCENVYMGEIRLETRIKEAKDACKQGEWKGTNNP